MLVLRSAGVDLLAGKIDYNVWEHIAVARVGKSTNLYVNGIPITQAITFDKAVSGPVTWGLGDLGYIDEVRVSDAVRDTTVNGKVLLKLPLVDSLTWFMGTETVQGPRADIPWTMWNAIPHGFASFTFTSNSRSQPYVMVNMFRPGPPDKPLMWSKNGDPVTFRAGVPMIATLQDTSGDGRIDRISFVVDTILWPFDVQLIESLPGAAEFLLNAQITLRGSGDKTVVLKPAGSPPIKTGLRSLVLSIDQSGIPQATTWQSASITICSTPLTTTSMPLTVSSIKDGVGPILTGAFLYAAIGSDGKRLYANDTLKIIASEQITVPAGAVPSDLFLYYALNGANTAAFAGIGSGSLFGKDSVAWIIMTNGFPVTPYDDSVALESAGTAPGLVNDNYGNASNAANPRVQILWGNEYDWRLVAGPNPYNPNGTESNLPASIMNALKGPDVDPAVKNLRRALTVIADPVKRSTGEGMVFDAMGNAVLKKRKLVKDTRPNKLYFLWEGTNESGRRVGSGTYLVRITLTPESGPAATKSIKVGIKR